MPQLQPVRGRGAASGAPVGSDGDEAAARAEQPDRDRHVVRRDSDDHVGRRGLDEVAGAAGLQDRAQQLGVAQDGDRVAPAYPGERGEDRGQLGVSGV